jgi:hypothetical protein
LLTLLLGASAAAVWVSRLDDSPGSAMVDVVERGRGVTRKAADVQQSLSSISKPLVSLAVTQRAPMNVSDNNPFGTKSWFVPPPPPPPAPPAAPSAPPLPFAYAGKIEQEDGSWAYVLMRGEQSYIVRVGDAIDGSYRLRSFENSNLVIEYTPLGIQQAIALGGEIN